MVVVGLFTQALPLQYWPVGQDVDEVEVELTQLDPFQYIPDPQVVLELEEVEVTQALPFQYCPEVQVVLLPLADCGELQQLPLYQYQPEEPHTAESKQLPGVLQLELEVVLVTQAVPFQY